LSEVLNAEATSSEEGGFSRRRVVKGVAWSVPVIVAAVGAPPASASPGPTTPPKFTIAFDPVAPAAINIFKESSNGIGSARKGLGPLKLVVQNRPATIEGTITIAASRPEDRAWIAVKSLTGGTLGTSDRKVVGTLHTSTTSYTLPGSQAEYPIVFCFFDDSKPSPASGDITFTATVTVTGSTAQAIFPNLTMPVP
jgi:hypothetical protein